MESTARQRGADKVGRNPIRIHPAPAADVLPKPRWIRARAPHGSRFREIKSILRRNRLHSVCEEASCPNIGECFGNGTATFMVLGDLCTRRCAFCDVAHGRPGPPDPEEPENLARVVAELRLGHVVVTSVDRDDLRDGGAAHFAECVAAVRRAAPRTRVEILVPDFRGRLGRALDILSEEPPDVMNHNVETVPRLYREVRPGADFAHSLRLLLEFGRRHPGVPTKSGIMVGLGETDDEVRETLAEIRRHDVGMLTVGQYLQPSPHHLPVRRYVPPETFAKYREWAEAMGFDHAACGPMVRSSYHADLQAEQAARHG